MIKHSIKDGMISIETDALHAKVQTKGYVSGVAAGSLVDKKTGARDLGYGLSIADFLLEPADPRESIAKEQYHYDRDTGDYTDSYNPHGTILKRYVEGPQICTQAKKLEYEITEGDGFLSLRQGYTWHKPYGNYKAGSRWEQLLVFPEKSRYFFSTDRVTTVNKCKSQFLRIDMPGHLNHQRDDNFEHVYLSYADAMLPCTEFDFDFGPHEQNLYQRGKKKMPNHFIRAYQVKLQDKPGPWLAGITLHPPDVYEAWCHQRGYICMIQEIGGWATEPGDTFGAAYVVGWFDDLKAMEAASQTHHGWSGLVLTGPTGSPTGFAGVQQEELTPI